MECRRLRSKAAHFPIRRASWRW